MKKLIPLLVILFSLCSPLLAQPKTMADTTTAFDRKQTYYHWVDQLFRHNLITRDYYSAKEWAEVYQAYLDGELGGLDAADSTKLYNAVLITGAQTIVGAKTFEAATTMNDLFQTAGAWHYFNSKWRFGLDGNELVIQYNYDPEGWTTIQTFTP